MFTLVLAYSCDHFVTDGTLALKGEHMQNGLIYRVGNCWLLRYWTTVLEDGKPVKRRVAKKLATFSREYRTEASVRHLAARILAPINARTARPESTDTLAAFLQTYIANREAEGRL